ncbi:MAG: YidC/Oxa1 family insertase periplasmic-domain containing protein, partial [Tidjanibacter sp.]|nr:YidC/Oxa1 family insertase periplasmic-domain containing protein [Tidjanibacter sp.]
MDKKSVIGLVLIGVILFGFSWYNNKQYDKQIAAQQEEMQRQALLDSLDRVHHPEKYLDQQVTVREVDQTAVDSIMAVAEANRINTFGAALVAAEKGEEKFYTLENSVMKMTISNKGGAVEQVELKEYRRYSKEGNGELVKMWADGSEQFDMQFFVRRNYNYAQINTAGYYFTGPEQTLFVAESSEQRLALRLPMTDEGGYVEFVYTMAPDDYMVDFDVNFVGMDAEISGLTELTFDWKNTSLQNEKGYTNENNYTTISYLFPGEKKIDDLGIGV